MTQGSSWKGGIEQVDWGLVGIGRREIQQGDRGRKYMGEMTRIRNSSELKQTLSALETLRNLGERYYQRLLLMGNTGPDMTILYNQKRPQVGGLGHQLSHKSLNTYIMYWDQNLAKSSSERLERHHPVTDRSRCSQTHTQILVGTWGVL